MSLIFINRVGVSKAFHPHAPLQCHRFFFCTNNCSQQTGYLKCFAQRRRPVEKVSHPRCAFQRRWLRKPLDKIERLPRETCDSIFVHATIRIIFKVVFLRTALTPLHLSLEGPTLGPLTAFDTPRTAPSVNMDTAPR